MTIELCTLFDVNYLVRGLVLYDSLVRNCSDFRLHVLCMDTQSEALLRRMQLPRVELIGLRDLEHFDSELAGVKESRSRAEYCWTATPSVCLYVLEKHPSVGDVTYLDADLAFFSDPRPLFDEFGTGSILIVPHRYAPRHSYLEAESGIYNVGLLTFRRDGHGLEALRWWHDRCIEWCFAVPEDGKMGDQMYLDDWPQRFAGVHVLEHVGGGLAPWNSQQYDITKRGGRIEVDGLPLVFYHFHSLTLFASSTVSRALGRFDDKLRGSTAEAPFQWRTHYSLGAAEEGLVWAPYVDELAGELTKLRKLEPSFSHGFRPLPAATLARRFVRRIGRKVVRGARQINPVNSPVGRRRRYTSSWKNTTVAGRMLELSEAGLQNPRGVPPYRVFLAAIERLLRDPDFPAVARLVDVGCGTGAYGEILACFFPGRFEYVGVDYSEEVLVVARARWPTRSFAQVDLLRDGVPGGFDVVVASALLDVLADFRAGLDRLFACDARYLLLHRQRTTSRRSRVRVAPGYQGQLTYRSYLNVDALAGASADAGWREVARLQVDDDVWSFLFERDYPPSR